MRPRDTGKLRCMPSGRRRNSIESAVVLQAARMGEIHRRVALFTGERGVVYATAHGAGKAVSKLKAAAIPFALITAYLYHDPVRNSYKVTDVSARNCIRIRADLRKFFTACCGWEIVLLSQAPAPMRTGCSPCCGVAAALDGRVRGDVALLSARFLVGARCCYGHTPSAATPGAGKSAARGLRLAGTRRQLVFNVARGARCLLHLPDFPWPGSMDASRRAFYRHRRRRRRRALTFAGASSLRRFVQELVQHGLEAR